MAIWAIKLGIDIKKKRKRDLRNFFIPERLESNILRNGKEINKKGLEKKYQNRS